MKRERLPFRKMDVYLVDLAPELLVIAPAD
jgi:hypothetical protein